MAQSTKVLRVFVASPGDCAPERAIVRKAINELNELLSTTNATRLEFVGWETHTRPAATRDPQATIIKQIGDYDILIGILWKRMGTATARADSGTAEEIEDALERNRRNPDSVRVMVYTKTACIEMDHNFDVGQLARVSEYKRLLRQETYSMEFRETNDLYEMIKLHLIIEVQSHGKDWGLVKASQQ